MDDGLKEKLVLLVVTKGLKALVLQTTTKRMTVQPEKPRIVIFCVFRFLDD